MYMVTTAARISQSSFASEPRNALAAPWKAICALAGTPISSFAFWITSTASPSDAPGARLNEMVAAGNWPRWLMTSGAVCSETRAMDESGTCVVPAPESVAAALVAAPEVPAFGFALDDAEGAAELAFAAFAPLAVT